MKTRLETKLANALRSMLNVWYRVPGCRLPDCRVCRENKRLEDKARIAVKAYEAKR